MVDLGLDQSVHLLTISLRDDQGDVVLACQVSTLPEKILQSDRDQVVVRSEIGMSGAGEVVRRIGGMIHTGRYWQPQILI